MLDLTKLPVVIDEPGIYAIDRDWRIPRSAADVNPELIRITVQDVTLDLHDFEISADINAPPASTLIAIAWRPTCRSRSAARCKTDWGGNVRH